MSIKCQTEACPAEIPSGDWIHLGDKIEEYRCKVCGKKTTIDTPQNQPTRNFSFEKPFHLKKPGYKDFMVIDKAKLIAAAEDCKMCNKDCDRCKVIEGCGI